MNHQEITPIVSVLVLTYNQESTIRRTLDSILAQETSYPYEIIIGEDYGTDGTRTICEEYAQKYDKVFLVHQTENYGVTKNYCNTVTHAKGQYLMVCAGDDYWHNKRKIQLQVEYMEAHPKCVVCHTDIDLLHTKTGKIVHDYKRVNNVRIPTGYIQQEIYSGRENISAVTMCIRKSLFDKYIPKDDFIRLGFPREDWPTLIILSRYGTIEYIPISTATYTRDHKSLSNVSNYKKIIQMHEADFRMTKYLSNLFPDDLPIDEPFWILWINEKLLKAAYRNHDYTTAKKYAGLMQKQNLMTRCTKNKLLFWGYIGLKLFKNSLMRNK